MSQVSQAYGIGPAILGLPEIRKDAKEAKEEFAQAKTAGQVEAILAERHPQHGDFLDQSAISQDLSEVMRGSRNYPELRSDQREALEMIQIKIARILEGDADFIDHWDDIAGYATLVAKRLRRK